MRMSNKNNRYAAELFGGFFMAKTSFFNNAEKMKMIFKIKLDKR